MLVAHLKFDFFINLLRRGKIRVMRNKRWRNLRWQASKQWAVSSYFPHISTASLAWRFAAYFLFCTKFQVFWKQEMLANLSESKHRSQKRNYLRARTRSFTFISVPSIFEWLALYKPFVSVFVSNETTHRATFSHDYPNPSTAVFSSCSIFSENFFSFRGFKLVSRFMQGIFQQ